MAVYGVECCSHLGLRGDVSSYKTYPAADVTCVASSRLYRPSESEQQLMCFSRRHTACPRLTKAAPDSPAQRRAVYRGQPTAASVLLVFLLAGLILLAFGFRVVHAGDYSLWWDETLSYHRASGGLLYTLSNRIMLGSVNTIDQHPPLYFVLLSAVMAVARQ